MTGWAVKTAAEDAQQQLFDLAAPMLEAAPEELAARAGAIYVTDDPERRVALARVAAKAPEAIIGNATTNPTLKDLARESFAAPFAEVEVDTRTGLVRVLRYVAAHDSGQVINPLTAESQIQGGVHMGISQALMEEVGWERRTGRPIRLGFHFAHVLTHLESPPVQAHFVDNVDPYGPFGAKVVGEPGITATPATIANAVFNANGVRVYELPMSPERVLAALRGENA
jgi:xanthine dehydrogenase molybdenum-binding subunit